MGDQEAKISAAKTALEESPDQSLRVPCYCEENVWRLTYRKIHGAQQESDKKVHYHVVFITNPQKCVPMFQQLASAHPLKPVFWDYHVILISSTTTSDNNENVVSIVLDIDCHLPYPSTITDYLNHVFPPDLQLPEEYQPYFR